jgi:hypothetical protein
LHCYLLPLDLPTDPLPASVPAPPLPPRLPSADSEDDIPPPSPASPTSVAEIAAENVNEIFMDEGDIKETAKFMREFTVQSLIPWMERNVFEWNEAVRIFFSTIEWVEFITALTAVRFDTSPTVAFVLLNTPVVWLRLWRFCCKFLSFSSAVPFLHILNGSKRASRFRYSRRWEHHKCKRCCRGRRNWSATPTCRVCNGFGRH